MLKFSGFLKTLLLTPIVMCAAQPALAQLSGLGTSEIDGHELRLLQDDDLVAAFAGKTHYGTYKDFRERTGTSQYSENTRANGTTVYKEGSMELTGRWRASGDQICYVYDSEITGVHCFIIFEAGTCLYGYNPANVTAHGPINPNFWNAKSIREGDVSTCDDLLG